MKRIGIGRRKVWNERPWLEALSADPRDPDIVRAKALARTAHPAGTSGNDRLGRHALTADRRGWPARAFMPRSSGKSPGSGIGASNKRRKVCSG
jgi:hypothetical protein